MFNPLCGFSLRRGARRLAVIDIILFFLTLIVSVALEWALFKSQPMKIILFPDDHDQFEEVDLAVGQAVWTHLAHWIHSATSYHSGLGYVLYTFSLLLLMAWIILEIWLCCVLIRATHEKKTSLCKKWFWWRVGLLLASFTMTLINIAQMQYTCTDLVMQPLNIIRLFSLLVVHQLSKKFERHERKHHHSSLSQHPHHSHSHHFRAATTAMPK